LIRYSRTNPPDRYVRAALPMQRNIWLLAKFSSYVFILVRVRKQMSSFLFRCPIALHLSREILEPQDTANSTSRDYSAITTCNPIEGSGMEMLQAQSRLLDVLGQEQRSSSGFVDVRHEITRDTRCA
jgi:hypothetical protein